MKIDKINWRFNFVFFFFSFFFLLIISRIIYLQFFREEFLKKLAHSQRYSLISLEGERGKIYDCKGRVLATNINAFSIYADPSRIKEKDKKNYSLLLSRILKMNPLKIEKRLRLKRRFVWIKRKVSFEEKEKIKELSLKEIGWIREKKRFYPQERLASHILGGVDIDNHGIEGVELKYDFYLRGKKGLVQVLKDASSTLYSSPFLFSPGRGKDLILTIDAQIQYWTERYLEETIKYFKAKKGAVIVMNPFNGEILALANFPNFNPNYLPETPQEYLRNYAISTVFEPGSVFKIVTLTAAVANHLDEKVKTIFCEQGSFKIPGSVLHDWRAFDNLSFEEVFEKSSNIGVAKLASLLGKDTIYHYIKKLGFGRKTDIDLPGEEKGLLKPPSLWSRTSSFIIPIGQGIGVTLIQLVKAVSIIVNGGFDIQPHVVKKIVGEGFLKEKKYSRKKVLSDWIAEKVKKVLIEIVKEGTGKKAKIEGIKVGGKTGTAQKFDFRLKRYSQTFYQASFVGFLESKDMCLVIGVTIEEPKKSHFGGVVAASLFRKIAQKIIDYNQSMQLELVKQ